MLINTHNKNTKPTTIKKLVLKEAKLAPWETAHTKTNTTGTGKIRVKNLPISKGFFAVEDFLRTFFLIFNFEAGFGNPHLGQVLASVETAFPHSLQFDIAITHYPTTICDYI